MSVTQYAGTRTVTVSWRALLDIGLKHCNDCHGIKPIDQFSSYRQGRYRRHRSYCKACASDRTMQWIARSRGEG